MKNTYFFGAEPKSNDSPPKIISPAVTPDGGSVSRASFPDQDVTYSAPANQFSRVNNAPRRNRHQVQISDGRGFCLAGATDWDELIVIVDDEEDKPWRVTPGMLVRTPIKRKIEVRPPTPCPSQRIANVRGLDLAGNTLVLPSGQVWTGINGPARLRNDGAAAVQLYQWSGTAWVATGAPLAVGAVVQTPAAANVSLGDNAAVIAGNSTRAGDWSPDGKWSFADYANAGQVGGAFTGPIASAFLVDSNGNPGDAAGGTGLQWPSIFLPWICVDASDKLAIYYGKAALDVWESEDPPCDYTPRLPADRVVVMPQLAIGASAVADTPNQARLYVPAINVEWAQLTFRSKAGVPQHACAALGSPLPKDLPSDVANVQSPAAVEGAVAGGAAAAFFPNTHPWVQVIFGSGSIAAGTTIDQAVLTLRRKFVG